MLDGSLDHGVGSGGECMQQTTNPWQSSMHRGEGEAANPWQSSMHREEGETACRMHVCCWHAKGPDAVPAAIAMNLVAFQGAQDRQARGQVRDHAEK